MATFTMTLTVPDELVEGIALFKGYQPIVTKNIIVVDDETTTPPTTHFKTVETPNEETSEAYVTRLFKKHTE